MWRYLTGAPLTFSWLTLLLITTVIQHSMSQHTMHRLLAARSTNLHHLAADPGRVLFSSLLWIDGWYWWPYLVVFAVFLAPAERWLGPLRWLATGLIAHVVATYVGEGFLYWRIQQAVASPQLIDARDVGVSYFALGIVGILTYHIVAPWRWLYLGVATVAFTTALALERGFTAVGHLCALAVGVACYPLARRRPRPPWDPMRRRRRLDSSDRPPA